MEVNEVISAISTLGFPICAYLGLFWYIVKSEERHKEEMNKMAEAINNNTLALTRLEAAVERRDNNA